MHLLRESLAGIALAAVLVFGAAAPLQASPDGSVDLSSATVSTVAADAATVYLPMLCPFEPGLYQIVDGNGEQVGWMAVDSDCDILVFPA